jgi:hypothetical protein
MDLYGNFGLYYKTIEVNVNKKLQHIAMINIPMIDLSSNIAKILLVHPLFIL